MYRFNIKVAVNDIVVRVATQKSQLAGGSEDKAEHQQIPSAANRLAKQTLMDMMKPPDRDRGL